MSRAAAIYTKMHDHDLIMSEWRVVRRSRSPIERKVFHVELETRTSYQTRTSAETPRLAIRRTEERRSSTLSLATRDCIGVRATARCPGETSYSPPRASFFHRRGRCGRLPRKYHRVACRRPTSAPSRQSRRRPAPRSARPKRWSGARGRAEIPNALPVRCPLPYRRVLRREPEL